VPAAAAAAVQVVVPVAAAAAAVLQAPDTGAPAHGPRILDCETS